jgi:glycosyltransferase involved in cell wall biosynthesis
MDNKKFFSICVPTYNRANLIKELLESLKNQKFKNFEVVICDDCSSDNTYDVVRTYYSLFDIKYIKLDENKGRAYALKTAIMHANGLYTILMDSDDYFNNNILLHIYKRLKNIDTNHICGIMGLCATKDGKVIGNKFKKENCNKSILELRCNDKIRGDKKEIIYSQLLKQYIYNVQNNERRVPTSVIWNKISKNYKICVDNTIYVFKDYLEEGMTKNINKIRKNSPHGSLSAYYEIITYDKRLSYKCKFKSIVNYWRYYLHGAKKKKIDIKYFIFLPIGFCLYLWDKIND